MTEIKNFTDVIKDRYILPRSSQEGKQLAWYRRGQLDCVISVIGEYYTAIILITLYYLQRCFKPHAEKKRTENCSSFA